MHILFAGSRPVYLQHATLSIMEQGFCGVGEHGSKKLTSVPEVLTNAEEPRRLLACAGPQI